MSREPVIIDPEAITARHLDLFEEVSGASLLSLADPTTGDFDTAKMAPAALTGLILIGLRMEGHTEATADDAADVPFARLMFKEGAHTEPDAPPLLFEPDELTPRMLDRYLAETGTSLLDLVDDKGAFELPKMTPRQIAGVILLALLTTEPSSTIDEAYDVPFARLKVEEAPTPADPTLAG